MKLPVMINKLQLYIFRELMYIKIINVHNTKIDYYYKFKLLLLMFTTHKNWLLLYTLGFSY